MEDAVTGADVGQEGVSQALAGMSTFHQAGNVNHIKEGWDFAVIQEVKGKDFKYYQYHCDINRNCTYCAAIQ